MKRISPATVTFGVMAIVLGLVAAYIVRQSMEKPPVVQAPPPPAPEPPKPDLVPVVFASVNIPKHTKISPGDVYVGYVGKETKAATGTFKGTPLAEGRITTQAIRAGQAIRDEYLMGIGEGLPDLAERIPAGHRAVTIQVQGADTGGKRLEEGDRVDLAMTVEGTHPDLGEVLTRTLLRNVLIVDAVAGRPLVRRGQPKEPAANLITVAVMPADANKLIVAERTGTLVATLVSMQDVDAAAPAADDVITRRQLLGLKEIPQPRRFTIEKWSGGSVRVIEMSDDRIRESREVEARQRLDPVNAAAAEQNKTTAIHSGVKVPQAALAVAAEEAR
ncbi:MAG: Flp pilus assembly protein CpaB [Planctomycetaceae bacterium]|nr:Flp pilus assembly protein CpaB [Planctomycetaceae bacterium]